MSAPTPTADAPPRDDAPLRELLRMAAPTVATMSSYTLMQFVDGLMVARITPADPVYIAAQGNGGVWAFVPQSLLAGVVGLVNTYVAQHLGAGNPQRGGAYAWASLWLALFTWLLMIPYALALPAIFALMGHDQRLVGLESDYAQILIFGAIFSMANRGIAQYFFGMHRPMIVLAAALTGNVVNVLANWLLIFGHEPLGIPALGVAGAAWGTIIGSAVEAVIPLAVFLSPAWHRRYQTRAPWRFDPRYARDLIRLGWPAALMFGNEMICWSIFMTALAGGFGPDQNAAGWIILRYMHLSFMPAVGISHAITAVVGRCLGARRPDLVPRRVALALGLTMGYMSLCALAFVLFPGPLMRLFIPEHGPGALAPERVDAILKVGAQIAIVAAIFQAFDGLGITLVGVLRGAGDTVWPGVAAAVLSWTCIIGLGALIVALAPHWGALGPWIAAGVYIIVLGLALWFRYRGGHWRTGTLVDPSAAAATPAPATTT